MCWTQVQERLRDILDIAMTSSAFAALKSDGSCIMWGNIAAGGDCRSSIQESDYVGMLDGGVSFKKKELTCPLWSSLVLSLMYDPIPGATGQCPADCRLSHGLRCNPQRRASRYLGNTGRNWPATSPGHLENTGKSYSIVIKLAFFCNSREKTWLAQPKFDNQMGRRQ